METKLQTKLIKYLKKKGCYVIKTKPGPGTPVGCPDVLALLEGFWAAFEIKAYPNSRFRPLQQETVDKFDNWSFARVVHSGNIDEIIEELDTIL